MSAAARKALRSLVRSSSKSPSSVFSKTFLCGQIIEITLEFLVFFKCKFSNPKRWVDFDSN